MFISKVELLLRNVFNISLLIIGFSFLEQSQAQINNFCNRISASPIDLTKNLNTYVYDAATVIHETNYKNLTSPTINKEGNSYFLKANDMGYFILKHKGFYKKFNLRSISIFNPSEYTIDGKRGDLEFQLNHERDSAYSNNLNTGSFDPSSHSQLVISMVFIVKNYGQNPFIDAINNIYETFNKNQYNSNGRILEYLFNDRSVKDINIKTIIDNDTHIRDLTTGYNFPKIPLYINNNYFNSTLYRFIDLNNYVNKYNMFFMYEGTSLRVQNSCDQERLYMFMNKFFFLSQNQHNVISKFVQFDELLSKYQNKKMNQNSVSKLYYNNITLGVNSLVNKGWHLQLIIKMFGILVYLLIF